MLNHTEARLQTFTGRKTWQEPLESGDTFSLSYEATVEKGTLVLQVENGQDQVIWEETLETETSASDGTALVAEEGDSYTIVVEGESAGGRYQLAWDVVR